MAQPYAQNTSLNDRDNNTIVGFFTRKSDAYSAISDLKDAGLTHDQIGLAMRDDTEDVSTSSSATHPETERSGKDKSFWREVKDFFSGGSQDSESHDFRSSLSGMELEDDRANHYYQGLGSGGAPVTVRA